MSFFGQPAIPGAVMQPMSELRAAPPIYRADQGGQYIPGEVEVIPFQGAVLPLSEKDLQRLPQGTNTREARKVYTNDHALADGTQVRDASGQVYTVRGDLDYGSISTIKRYIVERKGAAGDKGLTP